MAREAQPMFRATALQLTLSTITVHPQRARLEAAIPPGLRETIERARPSEWMPATKLMALFEVLWQVLERDGFIDFYVRQIERAQSSTAFSQFMTRLTNLMAPSPAVRIRYLQIGLDLVQRDTGRMQVELDGTQAAKIVLTGLPSVLRNLCYATSLIATIKSSALLVGYAAEVDIDVRELASGTVHYQLRWWK